MKPLFIQLCVTLLLFLPVSSMAQEQGLFESANEQTIELTEAQQKLLDVIRSRPQSQAVQLVTISGTEQFEGQSSIKLNFFDREDIIVQRQNITRKPDKSIVWEGKSEDPTETFTFVASGDKVTGFMLSRAFNYAVEPLGGGLHALIKIDASKFSQEAEPVQLEETKQEKGKSKMTQSSSNQIDVLVVYTSNASLYSGDIDGLIDASESLANQSFSNSSISANINVVGKVQVSYSESGSVEDDLDALRLTSDGDMDNVHTLRDNYGADLVSLIIGYSNDNKCGIAFLPSFYSTGFSVVRYDCAGSGLTFSHEIGHNLGAAHDIPNANVSAYTYGHGYKAQNWRTIMASNLLSETRINYWSNPDIDHGFPGYEVPMGTAQYEDNARVWSERVATVAGFNSPPPSISISGPTVVQYNETETWYSNVSEGEPPYSYVWHSSTNNGYTWTQIGTSANYTGAFPLTSNLKLRVTVTDDNAKTDQDILDVVVTDGGCIICKVANLPQEFTLDQNYPNPFNPSTQIKYALPEQADVSIRVYNIMGQQVATLVNTNMRAGFHEVNFDAGNLASGVYLTRMEAIGQSGEQFSEELKMQLIK